MISLRLNDISQKAVFHSISNYKSLSESVEKLASGKRINHAKENPAGIALAGSIRCSRTAAEMGMKNANDAINCIHIQESTLLEISNILGRMKQLAQQAATETYSESQIKIINNEYQKFAEQLKSVTDSVHLNGIGLLNNQADIDINIDRTILKITRENPIENVNFGNLTSMTSSADALNTINQTIEQNAYVLAQKGVEANSIKLQIEYLEIENQARIQSLSRITDTDMATEMATLTRNKILSQSCTAMIVQSKDIRRDLVTALVRG